MLQSREGPDLSSALIEGVARAGNGFSQMVGNGEKLDSKIVRMLKGALTPHINDYELEIKYEDDSVDRVADCLRLKLLIDDVQDGKVQATEAGQQDKKTIPLFSLNAEEMQLETAGSSYRYRPFFDWRELSDDSDLPVPTFSYHVHTLALNCR